MYPSLKIRDIRRWPAILERKIFIKLSSDTGIGARFLDYTRITEEMDLQRDSMWAYIKHFDGRTEEREFPAGVYVEIGDILEDGSVVVDVPYPDETDDDTDSLDFYDD